MKQQSILFNLGVISLLLISSPVFVSNAKYAGKYYTLFYLVPPHPMIMVFFSVAALSAEICYLVFYWSLGPYWLVNLGLKNACIDIP
jgi:hypothetical protein